MQKNNQRVTKEQFRANVIKDFNIHNYKFQACVFSDAFLNKCRGKLIVFFAEGQKAEKVIPDALMLCADKQIEVPFTIYKPDIMTDKPIMLSAGLKSGQVNTKLIYPGMQPQHIILTDKNHVCIYFGQEMNGCFPVLF